MLALLHSQTAVYSMLQAFANHRCTTVLVPRLANATAADVFRRPFTTTWIYQGLFLR